MTKKRKLAAFLENETGFCLMDDPHCSKFGAMDDRIVALYTDWHVEFGISVGLDPKAAAHLGHMVRGTYTDTENDSTAALLEDSELLDWIWTNLIQTLAGAVGEATDYRMCIAELAGKVFLAEESDFYE